MACIILLKQLTHFQLDQYSGRDNHCSLADGNFAAVARAMGAEGIRVARPQEIGPALTELIDSGNPGVLEIMISQDEDIAPPYVASNFDPSVRPLRLLEKYSTRNSFRISIGVNEVNYVLLLVSIINEDIQ